MSVFSSLLVLTLTAQAADAGRYANQAEPDLASPPAAQAAEPTLANPAQAAAQAEQPAVQSPAASAVENQSAQSPAAAAAAFDTQTQAPPAAASAATEPQKSVLIAGPKPSDLMKGILKPPARAALAGVPITLSDAVRDARNRQEQTQRAKAYWDLSAAMADFYLAQLEEMELGALRQGLKAPGQNWDAKQKDAQARTDIARGAAQAAQLNLHQLLGRAATTALPVPDDAPHCGRYNAEYEEIFAQRPNPVAEQLSKLMPLRYDELRTQAQAVAEAETARDAARARINPNGDGSELLQAQDLLALRRRAFVATARDYNKEIAAYTELAAPADVPAERLVAMMIRTSAPVGQAPWTPSGVQQATALQPVPLQQPPQGSVQQPSPGQAPPQTFANGQQQPQQQPQQYESRRPGLLQRVFNRDREHSILVNRPHILGRVFGNQ
jgi:hypothetical protein